MTSPAPIIKCDLRPAVQCDMALLLQLCYCVLAILAARSAVCIDNCELHNSIDKADHCKFNLSTYSNYTVLTD
jgi:hypothetical protein